MGASALLGKIVAFLWKKAEGRTFSGDSEKKKVALTGKLAAISMAVGGDAITAMIFFPRD